MCVCVSQEPFLRGAALHYTWSDFTPGPETEFVEEGINAARLDTLATHTPGADSAAMGSAVSGSRGSVEIARGVSGSVSGGVVRMRSDDVAQQIELLSDGLIGRGTW